MLNSMEPMVIAGVSIALGEYKQINAQVAKLPTRTPIEIPVIVSRSEKPGPTLLLMGGMHGNEINGVEIVRRIISNKYNRPQIGTVICIPLLNIYGFINFSREIADGGKDINRSFPGNRNGSLASQIAYHLTNEILPYIDCGIDFHTGGARINNFPQIRAMLGSESNVTLANAFATKYVINSGYREKSLRSTADKIGKSILIFEGGESLRLRKNAIDEGVNGALRVMKHLGMRDEAPEPKYEVIQLKSTTWLRAKVSGLYHSYFRPGDTVSKGDVVGLITDPFGEFEQRVKAHITGHVIAINNSPVMNRGDALMHIGVEQ